jgi:hypothetical protein
MRSIENTAVNDLISRASGGRRVSASMTVVDDADGDPDPDAAQLTLPVAMPVAAPFEPRRTTSPYPVVHHYPAPAPAPEWPPMTAPEFLEPASPRRLYEQAARVEQGEIGSQGPGGVSQERMIPTFRLRRPSDVRSIVARLVFPVALLMSVGVVIGAYVAFSGDRRAVRDELVATAPAAAPSQAPAAASTTAPAAAAARPVPQVTAAPVAALATAAPSAPEAPPAVAPVAPAPAAAAPAAPAAPALVDVRIDSIPVGATVMLIDRGRTQLIGDTPIDTAVDPSREYDLVFTSASAPPHIEHLDPRTTRRVEVALDPHDGAAGPADAPPRVEHAPAEHAPVEHAPVEHAPVEHTPARPARPRSEPRGEPRSEPPVGQGTLMISSKPPCEIVIDGRATGLTTPQRSIALSAGTHRITLLNSERSIRKVVSVQITASTTAKIIEDLMQ